MCLHKVPHWKEGIYDVVPYDLTSDDENGPIIATHGPVPGPEQGLLKLFNQFNDMQSSKIKPNKTHFSVEF